MCGIVFSCVLSVVLSGCGESINVLPATGTVTYQGKPVANASVTYMPDGTPGAAMGIGTTDAAGKYEIRTKGKPGATPGKNLVSISKQGATGMPANPTPEDMQKMAQKGRPEVKSEIPMKYGNPTQSGLTADVQSGKSVFDFELKD
jgi:hypothetical protein